MTTRPSSNIFDGQQYPTRDAAIAGGAIRDVTTQAVAAVSGFPQGWPVYITREAWQAVATREGDMPEDCDERSAVWARRITDVMKQVGMFPVRAGGPMMAASEPGRTITVPFDPPVHVPDGIAAEQRIWLQVRAELDGQGPGLFFTVSLSVEPEEQR